MDDTGLLLIHMENICYERLAPEMNFDIWRINLYTITKL